MEIDNNNVDRKYLRAKKRVDELKKYYRHLSIYIVFGGRLLFLNKDWEDKKIKEYMNEK